MEIVTLFADRAAMLGMPMWLYVVFLSVAVIALFQTARAIAIVPMFIAVYTFELAFMALMRGLAWVIDAGQGGCEYECKWHRDFGGKWSKTPKRAFDRLVGAALRAMIALTIANVIYSLYT